MIGLAWSKHASLLVASEEHEGGDNIISGNGVLVLCANLNHLLNVVDDGRPVVLVSAKDVDHS